MKYGISVYFMLIFLTFTTSSANVEAHRLSNKCEQKIQRNYVKYNNKMFKDVLNSYRDLNKENDNDNIIYFTSQGLFDIKVLLGKREKQLDSLYKYFEGGSRGDRRLYFFNGDPNLSYLLYKDTSSRNVMVKLKRTDKGWIKIDKDVKAGKKIEFINPKCADEKAHF
ncbi:hypothetical protein [Peribacillus sp. Hz7]|uniref:hypothetical protein n=1 Tax=Peribacillus sp. Hz7 TaxID=3344873 RepID=UPI0035C948FC